jgi:ATP-dependent DNA ligase
MTVIEALEFMEKAADGNARLDALKKADRACLDLRSVLFMALSPEVTFGVKKLPAPHDAQVAMLADDIEWLHELRDIMGALRERRLTGHDAQKRIASFLGICSKTQQKWSERILRQDLRLNLGAKEVNKVLGANTIYLFQVPLATDYAKVKAKDLAGDWYVQPKLDGGRCVAVIPSNKNLPIRLLSRTGKDWPNFESIRKGLEPMRTYAERHGEDLWIDGEVVSMVDGQIDFQSIQKTMMRKDGVEVGALQYIVFDACSAKEWKDPTAPYLRRYDFAKALVEAYGTLQVSLVPNSELLDPSVEDLEEMCRKFLDQGYEGAMLRYAQRPVVNKRSKLLIKVKLFKDDEALITGVAELQREGKGAGTLGALVCKHKNGKQFEIGSGFTAKQRDELWNLALLQPEMVVGQHVNFKYFELTDDGVPRFPIYRSIRHADDVGVEDEE